MLKVRSEMLNTRKKGKTINLGKNYRKIFPNPENFRDTEKFPELPENFLKIFHFPGSLISGKKGKP